ncbi:hypothetical protein GW17_00040564 [Ensete ventricosum]|nr:hypothetical protein GW17_00040564 [Ensete ventricosum]
MSSGFGLPSYPLSEHCWFRPLCTSSPQSSQDEVRARPDGWTPRVLPGGRLLVWWSSGRVEVPQLGSGAGSCKEVGSSPDRRILVNFPESPWLDVSNEVATHKVDDANLITHIPESPWMEVSKNKWSQAIAGDLDEEPVVPSQPCCEGSAHDFSEKPHIPETPWSQAPVRDFSEKPRIPKTPWSQASTRDFSKKPRIPETPWSQALAHDFNEKPRIPETPWSQAPIRDFSEKPRIPETP